MNENIESDETDFEDVEPLAVRIRVENLLGRPLVGNGMTIPVSTRYAACLDSIYSEEDLIGGIQVERNSAVLDTPVPPPAFATIYLVSLPVYMSGDFTNRPDVYYVVFGSSKGNIENLWYISQWVEPKHLPRFVKEEIELFDLVNLTSNTYTFKDGLCIPPSDKHRLVEPQFNRKTVNYFGSLSITSKKPILTVELPDPEEGIKFIVPKFVVELPEYAHRKDLCYVVARRSSKDGTWLVSTLHIR